MIRIFLICAFFVGISFEATAAEYGLAMHGMPKYNAESKALDYVNPDAPKGGTLKLAGIGTFDTVNPYAIKGVAAEGLAMVYDRLMQRVWDEPFTLYPLIAESVEVAPDRSWIIFSLNPKARFHDGSAVTAEDVLFSFTTLKEQGRPNMRRIYGLVDKVETIDSLKVKFTLGAGYDRETVMIIAMMPVLSKAWWSGKTFDASLIEAPLLNGPYKIKSIDPGRRIVYERVADYWAKDLLVNAGQYNFDQIVYEYFRDDTIALESLKKGDLDLRREWDVGKWEKAYSDLDLKRFRKIEIPHQRPERAHGMIFNLRRPPFDDVRVRKALALAFDQDWVGKNLYHGKFSRIESYFPNSSLDGSSILSEAARAFLEPHKDVLKADVFSEALKINDGRSERERLRAADLLLREAGWEVVSGKRQNKATQKPLVFEIILSSPQEQKIALTFQRSLERLGVTMTIRLLDSASFQDRKMAYDYDMLMFFWQNTLSPGTEQTLYWSCKSAAQESQFNYSGYCNPAMDDILAQIPDAQNYADLQATAQAMDRILLSEYLTIPLFYKASDYIVLKNEIDLPDSLPLYGFVMETLWTSTLPQ